MEIEDGIVSKGQDTPAGRSRVPSRRRASGRPPAASFPVVGIGASAGGVEAVGALLAALPSHTGMAYVVVQHLSPSHETILPEILARSTAMPVVLAGNEMEIAPDCVYVIPPGKDLSIFHGRLNLMERVDTSGRHLPIDYFLRSLATELGRQALAVILSGTGSDGTAGAMAVKSEGGITFAQDPSGAAYAGMPSAAIAAKAADIVGDPAAIAAEIVRLGRARYLKSGQAVELQMDEAVATEDEARRDDPECSCCCEASSGSTSAPIAPAPCAGASNGVSRCTASTP